MARERDAAPGLLSVKEGDDLGCSFREGLQSPGNRAPRGVKSFREAYVNAQIRICLRVGGNSPQWGAIFHCAHGEEHGIDVIPSSPSGNTNRTWTENGSDQFPVLAHNVKIVEGKQDFIPSLVWLELFDPTTIDIRKPSYFFDGPVYRVNEIEDAVSDREVDIFWSYMAVSLGQSYDENIKAAADHVNNRASLGIDPHWKGIPLKPSLNDILAGVTIWLSDSSVWATRGPLVNPIVQNIDLGYGPINGGTGTI